MSGVRLVVPASSGADLEKRCVFFRGMSAAVLCSIFFSFVFTVGNNMKNVEGSRILLVRSSDIDHVAYACVAA